MNFKIADRNNGKLSYYVNTPLYFLHSIRNGLTTICGIGALFSGEYLIFTLIWLAAATGISAVVCVFAVRWPYALRGGSVRAELDARASRGSS